MLNAKYIFTFLIGMSAVLQHSSALSDPQQLPVQQLSKQTQHQIKTEKASCADPAAYKINVELVSKRNEHQGRVRITGIIKNLGPGVWRSVNYNHALRAVLASSQGYSSPNGNAVTSPKTIKGMSVAYEEKIVYETNWSVNQSNANKRYILRFHEIGSASYQNHPDYSPDCNINNNVTEIKGSKINALFGSAKPDQIKPKENWIKLTSKKMLGWGKVQFNLRYKKKTNKHAKIFPSITHPYSETLAAQSINGYNGASSLTLNLNCTNYQNSKESAYITFELRPLLLSLPGHGSTYMASVATVKTKVPLNTACKPALVTGQQSLMKR